MYGQKRGTELRRSPEPKGEKRQFCSPCPILLHIKLTTWDQIPDFLLRPLLGYQCKRWPVQRQELSEFHDSIEV